jgi:predicted RNA-binding Zn-ribbon protein involved in translation (DUF1610 family)
MSDDKMLLTWNDHTSNAPNTFKQLWSDVEFTDVTLATADQQQIKVHKVIISSSSKFFRNILLKNPHTDPLIYLKGVRYKELERVLQFIYLGQCEVDHEDLQDFLDTGADLEVMGIMTDPISKYDEKRKQEEQLQWDLQKTNEQLAQMIKPKDEGINDDDLQDFLGTGADLEDMGIITDPISKYDEKRKQEKQLQWDSLKTNEQSAQMIKPEGEGMLLPSPAASQYNGKFGCNICDKEYMLRTSLWRHNNSEHKGMGYSCDQCDYKAAQLVSLTRHKKATHEGVKYDCDKCDYRATQKSSLVSHKQAKHEGYLYKCDYCDFRSSWKNDTKKHRRSQHNLETSIVDTILKM